MKDYFRWNKRELKVIEEFNVRPTSKVIDCFEAEFSPKKIISKGEMTEDIIGAALGPLAKLIASRKTQYITVGILEDSILVIFTEVEPSEKSIYSRYFYRVKWDDISKADIEIEFIKNFVGTRYIRFGFLLGDKMFRRDVQRHSKNNTEFIGYLGYEFLESKFNNK